MTYDYKEIVPYLLNWYDYDARILPWRENPKPYYIWVSEIMLQQTRVEAVKGYFDRFIKELPDIQALAEAPEEKLLKLWEGLGYYSRVRNMQKAAQMILKEYQGELPSDYEQLMKLPGIGSYTAGAIASIAYQMPVSAVDGNVLRVTARITGSFEDITKDSIKKEVGLDLKRIIPKERPGDFNQALMELGATVCLPNGKPDCSKCPVMHLCRAFHEDKVMQIPVKQAKKERRIEDRTILLIEYQDRYLIRKRAAKGLLASLWEFPGLERRLNLKEVEESLMAFGISAAETSAAVIKPIGEAKHIFSHVEWHMTGYYIRLLKGFQKIPEIDPYILAEREELIQTYSIPKAFSHYLNLLKEYKLR